MTVPVDGVKILILVLVSAVSVLIIVILALLLTFPLMEQVTRGCVVEQQDIRRDGQIPFIRIPSQWPK